MRDRRDDDAKFNVTGIGAVNMGEIAASENAAAKKRALKTVVIGVRANIHLGGQAEFFPNGEHKMFVTQPRQGEK